MTVTNVCNIDIKRRADEIKELDTVIHFRIFYLPISCPTFFRIKRIVWCLIYQQEFTFLTPVHPQKSRESTSEMAAPLRVDSVTPHNMIITGMLVDKWAN